MTAEILREAATEIRDRHDEAERTGFDEFMLAVADWMDWMAERAASGNDIPVMRGLGLEQALAVARAYLGEPS